MLRRASSLARPYSVLALSILLNCGEMARAEGNVILSDRSMNPDIGVNFLGFNRVQTHRNPALTLGVPEGWNFEEAEIQFSADVDPYLKANALFAMAAEDGGFVFEPEEVYFETLSLPAVTMKVGKFRSAVSRHNEMHTHAFPFLDAPLIESGLLGEEGLNDVGASASLLLPTPWFSEVTGQVLAASNEASFGSPRSGDMVQVLRWRNLWDLTDDSTLEWNLAGAQGANAWNHSSRIGTTSLTFKWRPSVMGKYQALALHAEYLAGNRAGRAIDAVLDGAAAWAQYQFAQRWWAQVRAEWMGVPVALDSGSNQRKQSVLLGFFPSEFSGFRAQYDHLSTAGVSEDDHRFTVQWNISIGAHPAHAY